ncbi:MAG: hypothetical protein JWM39_314 [Parcubacteria group bacterium]|nr:hypothetical protein [Parcubacteria group bacterium]
MDTSNAAFFIIPGFKDQVKDTQYKWLVSHLKDKGVTVMQTPVEWNNKTLSQNAAEFVTYFNTNQKKENYILGFSLGAVLALMTANLLLPKKIFLCSLSAVFAEDLKAIDASFADYAGKRRQADFATLNGRMLAKNLKVPAVVFYGEKEIEEFPKLKNRCEETVRLAKDAKLVMVKDAPHQIDFLAYKEAIKKVLNGIV